MGPIEQALNEGLNWGNAANLSEENVRARGINAVLSDLHQSPRLTSSGMTDEWTGHLTAAQKQKDEWRQGHFVRKGAHEKWKETVRRATWRQRHPNAPESNWVQREAARKTRKAGNRAARKVMRAASRKNASSERKRRAAYHRRP